jgi:ribulose-5-phosphate 4-epimerase/fuculose-1-phosphate aldolase
MEPKTEDQLRGEVVKGAKEIFQKGLVDVGEGNVSVRIPGRDELLITPTFNHYGKMTEQDVVHLKFDGTQLSSGQRASTEYRLHIAVYCARPRAGCVIHTHSSYASILSVVQMPIPVLMEEMVILLGGGVDVSMFRPAHTEDIGETAIQALGLTNAALLANHGALICGRTVDHATKMAEAVEKMAMIHWGAHQLGVPNVLKQALYEHLLKDFEANFSTT